VFISVQSIAVRARRKVRLPTHAIYVFDYDRITVAHLGDLSKRYTIRIDLSHVNVVLVGGETD
jgi:hypothetical protein